MTQSHSQQLSHLNMGLTSGCFMLWLRRTTVCCDCSHPEFLYMAFLTTEIKLDTLTICHLWRPHWFSVNKSSSANQSCGASLSGWSMIRYGTVTLRVVPPGWIWSLRLWSKTSLSRWMPPFFFSSDVINLVSYKQHFESSHFLFQPSTLHNVTCWIQNLRKKGFRCHRPILCFILYLKI